MGNLIHIAEIAALLLVAYSVGWATGYFAHRAASGLGKSTRAPIPTERLASAIGEADDALVKAPTVAGVTMTPLPSASPLPAEAVQAIEELARLPAAELRAPAPASALESLAKLSTDMPLLATQAEGEAVAAAESPPAAMPAEMSPPALPSSTPGLAWSGAIKGRLAEPFASAVATVTSAPEAVIANEPPDEGAAMRAIEGGWSRRAARALPDAPELSDLGAAVAAAQSAVQQVLAREGIDAEIGRAQAQRALGRPAGLSRPRESGRDNLKLISGLSASDEATLNNMGVYHFDQIGGWEQAEVLWMENHVFARGRIGRENWQAQARALALREAASSRVLRA